MPLLLNQVPVTADTEPTTLYAKGKKGQWDAADGIDWTLEDAADPLISEFSPGFAREVQALEVSQFYYGEQASAAVCGQLLGMLPDVRSRLYVTTQVMDEGRHMEVFGRYLARCGGVRPPLPAMRELLEDFTAAETYEEKVVGLQMLAESALLCSMKATRRTTSSALLREILERVSSDEARHSAFGLELMRGHAPLTPGMRERVQTSLYRWWRLFLESKRTFNPGLLKDFPADKLAAMSISPESTAAVIATTRQEVGAHLARIGFALEEG